VTREEVKAVRHKLKLTQAAFAEKVGVERVTVARWESGLSPVNRTAAILIHLLAQRARPRRRAR
jgi:DNA-binding transcriptional regulator YiaG